MKQETQNKLIEFGKGILIIFAFAFLPYVISPFFAKGIQSESFWIRNLAYLGFEIVIVGIFVILYRKRLLEDGKDFKKNYKEYLKKGIPLWIYGLLLMFVCNAFVSTFVGDLAANEAMNRIVMQKYPLYAIGGIVLLGPIMEEIVFRGSFKKAFSNQYLFAFITALIFASFHVFNGMTSIQDVVENWRALFYFLPYGSIAFMLELAYFKTNNIWTSISLHIMHNALTVGLVFLTFAIGS